jgi:hypothetical protein
LRFRAPIVTPATYHFGSDSLRLRHSRLSHALRRRYVPAVEARQDLAGANVIALAHQQLLQHAISSESQPHACGGTLNPARR